MSFIRWHSLRTKIIAWSFVPTALILMAVALTSYFAYQQVTETLAIERDRELTRLSASQLAGQLTIYADELGSLARLADIPEGELSSQQITLDQVANRLVIFDGGVVVLDHHGIVVAAQPLRPEVLAQDWSSRDYFRQIVRSPRIAFSNILDDGVEGTQVVAVAVPVLGRLGEFRGVAVGMFQLGPTAVSALYGSIVRLRLGQSGSLYLVDQGGRVIYHSDNARIGSDLSAQAAVQQVLEGQTGALRTSDLQGQQIVAGFAPVPGTPWSLVTEERWDALIGATGRYGQLALLLLVLGVVVPALVVAFGVRRITQPINDLIHAAREVALGNFGQAIRADTGDEIEALARQFNRMSAQLQQSYAQLEQQVTDRTEALAALNAVAAVASRSLDLDEVLYGALRKTLEVIKIEAGGVYLLDAETQELVLAAHAGMDARYADAIDHLPVGEGFSGRVVQSGESLVAEDLAADPRVARSLTREYGFQTIASVPLISSGQVLGALFVSSRSPRHFTDQEIELLSSIGQQVGVSVENARLIARAQEAAAVEERQRLARELHDAVTQTLFSASLIAEVLPRLWERSPEEGRRRLEELRLLSRGALAEMRTLLMELRPSALTEASLGDLLRQLTEAFTGRTRTPVELSLQDCPELPADVQVALYRIAQEGLNNVIKHARASQVRIRLSCEAGQIHLSVADDGQGFVPHRASAEHLGLGIMRERAQAIGAHLSIHSMPGQGTQVSVDWFPPS